MVIISYLRLSDHGERTEVLYLAAPIHTFYEPEYEHAINTIQARRPDGVLLLSRNMFSDSRDFVLTYRDKLVPVNTLYLLPDRNLRVGAGVYTEWEYLKHVSPNCKEALAFNPNKDFGIYSNYTLELLRPTVRSMREFASIIYYREKW